MKIGAGCGGESIPEEVLQGPAPGEGGIQPGEAEADVAGMGGGEEAAPEVGWVPAAMATHPRTSTVLLLGATPAAPAQAAVPSAPRPGLPPQTGSPRPAAQRSNLVARLHPESLHRVNCQTGNPGGNVASFNSKPSWWARLWRPGAFVRRRQPTAS